MTAHTPDCSRQEYALHLMRRAMSEALSMAETIEAHNRAARRRRRLESRPLPSPLPHLRHAAALASDIREVERWGLSLVLDGMIPSYS